jgi:antitoxin ParD1/3/4
MPTRNVVLTDHQTHLIECLVKSGRYSSASEVMREELRLVETREAEDNARLKALREAARIGFANIEGERFRRFDLPGLLDRNLQAIVEAISSVAAEDHTTSKCSYTVQIS